MADAEAPQADRLTEVLSTIDPTEIRIAQDFLKEAGIATFVFDTETSRMLGTAAAVPARLMVLSGDADRARRVLKDVCFKA